MFYTAAALKRIHVFTLLIVLCILSFAASTGYFRSDDFFQLGTHKFRVLPNPASIITEAEASGHYRPMVKVFWWVTYPFFGLHPLGYFVVIIIIFLLTQLAFFLLAKTLAGSITGAYVAALLLLLQVNTYLYTVRWIAAVTNVLSGIFLVTMLLFYAKSSQSASSKSTHYYLLSLLSFVFGLLSREIFLLLFSTVVVYDFFFLWLESSNKKRLILKKLPGYLPFLTLMSIYVAARSAAAGSNPLSGGDIYIFALGSHFLKSVVFFGLQLGFLPAVVVCLSLPAVLAHNLRLRKRELQIIAFGLFVALITILPFLFLEWTSPTWLYLPVVGTTLAMAPLFERVFIAALEKYARLLLYGTLISALAGTLLLFSRLSEARWWQWGTYSQGVIEQTLAYYPSLPHGAVLNFVDKDYQQPDSITELFRSQGNLSAAFKIWYDDASLRAQIWDTSSAIESAYAADNSTKIPTTYSFEYSGGLLLDKTNQLRSLLQ